MLSSELLWLCLIMSAELMKSKFARRPSVSFSTTTPDCATEKELTFEVQLFCSKGLNAYWPAWSWDDSLGWNITAINSLS